MADIDESKNPKVDLRALFRSMQDQMIVSLASNRQNIIHPGAVGNATEQKWCAMLSHFLPKRYSANKAFVVDADGNRSDEQDIVIFDRQYSPFAFYEEGMVAHLPAESVYAVIEVKQDLNKKNLKYAGAKAASVRRLRRTSAPVIHIDGCSAPKEPFYIPAGLITLDTKWKEPFGKSFASAIAGLGQDQRIDFGCILSKGAFAITYADDKPVEFDCSPTDEALIAFFLHLVYRLQQMATVCAMDILEYTKALSVEKHLFGSELPTL